MTAPAISTGLPLAASGDPSSVTDSDRAPWTRLFGVQSDNLNSHVVSAASHGLIFQAFGLVAEDALTIQMVVGPNEGDLFQDLVLNGVTATLTSDRTMVFIPFPGRYRLRYNDNGNLGDFYAFATPIPVEWFPGVAAGLTQFGA